MLNLTPAEALLLADWAVIVTLLLLGVGWPVIPLAAAAGILAWKASQ